MVRAVWFVAEGRIWICSNRVSIERSLLLELLDHHCWFRVRHGLRLGHLRFITDRIELATSEVSCVLISCRLRVALEGSCSEWLTLVKRHYIFLNFSHLLELPLEILIFNPQVFHNFILRRQERSHTHSLWFCIRLTALTKLVLRKAQF